MWLTNLVQQFLQFFDEIQQWYVVFHPRGAPRHRWFHFLLRDDFAHCFLARELPDGKSLVVDAQHWGIGVSIREESLEQLLLEQAKDATAIVGYTADYRRQTAYRTRAIYSCVNICKAVLGLYGCAQVQTPFGLYKLLVKHRTTTVVKPFIPYVKY